MNTTREWFASEVKQNRKRQGLKQEYVSKQVGLSQAYLSRLECGRAKISLESAIRLAKFLGISIDQRMGEEGEPATHIKSCEAYSLHTRAMCDRPLGHRGKHRFVKHPPADLDGLKENRTDTLEDDHP